MSTLPKMTDLGSGSTEPNPQQADLDAIVIIAPDEALAIDEIWTFDGTGGFDDRPDFVKADDERIQKS